MHQDTYLLCNEELQWWWRRAKAIHLKHCRSLPGKLKGSPGTWTFEFVIIIFWRKEICSQGTSDVDSSGWWLLCHHCCHSKGKPFATHHYESYAGYLIKTSTFAQSKLYRWMKSWCFIISVWYRGIIPIAIRSLGVRKKDMYAAKNLLLLLRPLQHTRRP